MNEEFYPLNSDDDVLLFDSDTFTVAKLKDLIKNEIQVRFLQLFIPQKINDLRYVIKRELFHISSLPSGPSGSWWLNEIQLNSFPRECKLLKVSSQGWEKGKIRILTYIQEEEVPAIIKVDLEFCPDKPDESLPILEELDEIRQSEEYKRLSNQNLKEDN